ncbi:hypothetical protein V6Z11_A03G141400 [Gossypium hirsutum]
MICTRSTCGGDSRNIDQHFTRNILRFGSIILENSRQCCRWRPRRGPINLRSGEDVIRGSTSAPSAQEDLIAVQPPCYPHNLRLKRGMYDGRLGHGRNQP